jgi:hypothetical protein
VLTAGQAKTVSSDETTSGTRVLIPRMVVIEVFMGLLTEIGFWDHSG